MKQPKSKTERSKRYYLHAKLKGVCNLVTSKRTIFCKPDELDAIRVNKHVIRLISDYGYSIQVEL